MPTAEGRLQAKTIAYAKSLGVEAIRFVFRPGVARGWPDVMFLIPGGKPLFVEFKAPGKGPSPIQRQRMVALLDAGYDAGYTDNFATACEAITRALDRTRLPAPCVGVPAPAKRSSSVLGPRARENVHCS